VTRHRPTIASVFNAVQALPFLTPDRAFGGSQERRDQAVQLAELHREADRVVQQQYWSDRGHPEGRGCTAGCMTHQGDGSSAHGMFPKLYGIPTQVSRLADMLFEEQTRDAAPEFHVKWISAIPVGADLRGVAPAMVAWGLRTFTLPRWQARLTTAENKLVDQGLALLDQAAAVQPYSKTEFAAFHKAVSNMYRFAPLGTPADHVFYHFIDLADALPEAATNPRISTVNPTGKIWGRDSKQQNAITAKFLELLAQAPVSA